jgi:hypothetical protein
VEEVDAVPVEGTGAPPAAPGTALALSPAVRQEVIRPLDLAQVKDAMDVYQRGLSQLLTSDDWQGPPGGDQSFVKKSGWRKIATWLNLSTTVVSGDVERDDDGKPLRASYTVRATAPTGRSMEATGHCSFSESRFSGPRGNVTKLENDLRNTAETRAKNRAISDLVGMGKVSAEEVDAGAGPAAAAPWPAYARPADGKALGRMAQALCRLLDVGDGPDDQRVMQAATVVANRISQEVAGQLPEGTKPYVPSGVARAFMHAAAALKQMLEANDPDAQQTPGAEPPPPDAEVVPDDPSPEPEPDPEPGDDTPPVQDPDDANIEF